MRWLGVVTALSIGCASAPAVHVELPTRCACPRSPALAGAPTAKTLTPTDWQLDAVKALNAQIACATTVSAIEADTPAACLEVDEKAREVLADLEPGIVEAVRDARRALDADPTVPLVERRLAAWALYDDALLTARDKIVVAIADAVADALVYEPKVTSALNAALDESVGHDYTIGPVYLNIARRRAPGLLPAAFRAAAQTCADVAINRGRGRWLAILKGKP
jgi:hypothetical protein